ncbi:MAG: hypothetical protein GWN47_09940 [Woeseiaceae bacterium]|nr:hypothetical protein [Woeseiaceae bacterium]
MKLFSIVFERIPLVWFLLGLLFFATGLYVGFDNRFSFVYLTVGAGCCAYGVAIMLFRFMEQPKQKTATRLSPNFISLGSTESLPVAPKTDEDQTAAQSAAE